MTQGFPNNYADKQGQLLVKWLTRKGINKVQQSESNVKIKSGLDVGEKIQALPCKFFIIQVTNWKLKNRLYWCQGDWARPLLQWLEANNCPGSQYWLSLSMQKTFRIRWNFVSFFNSESSWSKYTGVDRIFWLRHSQWEHFI